MDLAGQAQRVPGAAEAVAEFNASFDLPVSPEAAGLARRTVRDLLGTWRLADPDLRYDAELVTSELVTNAVRHGAERVCLDLTLAADSVVVAVEDGGPALAGLARPTAEAAEGGRGLAIIDAVSTEWGVTETEGGGKRVWSRLSLPKLPAQRQP